MVGCVMDVSPNAPSIFGALRYATTHPTIKASSKKADASSKNADASSKKADDSSKKSDASSKKADASS